MKPAKLVILLGVVAVAFVASQRFGSLAVMPIMLVGMVIPVLWLFRLMGAISTGVITSRLDRDQPGDGSWHFSLSSSEVLDRSETPIRFWAVFLREAVLFMVISAFLLVPVIGTIVEGPPGG